MRATRWIGLFVLAAAALAMAGDFQQWRGPERNGSSPGGPKLTENWPKAGPVKLWESEEILGTQGYGYGCVSVADGRAYVYVNWKYQVPIKTRTLADGALRGLGWADLPPKMPDPLVAAMEQARLDPAREKLAGKPLEEWIAKWLEANIADKNERDRIGKFVADRIRRGKNAGALLSGKLVTTMEDARVDPARAKLVGKPLEEWIAKWLEANIPDKNDRQQLGGWLADRIRRGAKAFALDDLAKLGTIRNREFPDVDALNTWFADNGIPEDVQKAVLRVVPTQVDQAHDTLFCLDAATGKTLWKMQVDGKPDGWGSSSTPCVADGLVYVGSSTGDVYCRDAKTGDEVWTYRAAANEKGLLHSSVLVADGLVVSMNGPLIALDAKAGSTVWRQPKVAGREVSPALYRSGERSVVLCTMGERFVGVDLKSGEVLWTVPGGSKSTVAVAGDVAVVRSGNKELGLVAYRMTATQPEKLWNVPECIGGDSSPAISGGLVYVIGGNMAWCVELAGGKLAWSQKLAGNGEPSPVVADGKVIALAGKTLQMFAATADKFSALANCPLVASDYASPAVADGKLFVRMPKSIACYDLTGTAVPPTTAPAGK